MFPVMTQYSLSPSPSPSHTQVHIYIHAPFLYVPRIKKKCCQLTTTHHWSYDASQIQRCSTAKHHGSQSQWNAVFEVVGRLTHYVKPWHVIGICYNIPVLFYHMAESSFLLLPVCIPLSIYPQLFIPSLQAPKASGSHLIPKCLQNFPEVSLTPNQDNIYFSSSPIPLKIIPSLRSY